jgi:hypothetical protein
MAANLVSRILPSEQHLKETCSHSCRFAVNVGAPDGHPSGSNSKRCGDCMSFFNTTLELIYNYDRLFDTSRRLDGGIQKEIVSMVLKK